MNALGRSLIMALAMGVSTASAATEEHDKEGVVLAVEELVGQVGGPVLVGLAGREAQALERVLERTLADTNVVYTAVPTLGHWDQEMQRVLSAQEIACGVRIQGLEEGDFQLSRHGSCRPSHSLPSSTSGPKPTPAATTPSSRSRKDTTEVNLRLIHIDMPLSEDGMGLMGMGGEIRVGDKLGVMPLLQLLNQSGITTAGLTATGRVYAMDFDKGPFMGASLGVATASYVWEQEVAWTGGVNVGAKYTFDPPLFLDVAFGYQLMLIDWENYGGLGLTLGGGWAF